MPDSKLPTLDQLNEQLESWSPILKGPLWYKQIMPVMLEAWAKYPKTPEVEPLKERTYQFFVDKLDSGEIALAKDGPDFDEGRKPIDTAIIHYTSNKPGISWQTLSVIGLLRQYAHDYYKYDDIWGKDIKGQSIWSGHFKGDQQVFFAYHWLVRADGSLERLLEDKYVGWHAGNGEVNKKSVAIVLDGEFLDSEPPEKSIEGVAEILRKHYPGIRPENILGHREINPQTQCPGNLFLPVWKDKILKMLE